MNWTTYLKHLPSFYFELSFKVNVDNYTERILKFDKALLTKGFEYGIVMFDAVSSYGAINRYLASRSSNFWTKPKNKILRFIDFEQWPEYNDEGTRFIILPSIEDEKIRGKRFDFRNSIHEVMSLEVSQDLSEGKLKEEFWEDKEMFMSLSSNSNIWWDEFNVTILNGEKWSDRKFINPPINNRPFSYQITPRFNSFLREMKEIIFDFDGKVKLEAHDTRRVTMDGILLDGKIIFQEDLSN